MKKDPYYTQTSLEHEGLTLIRKDAFSEQYRTERKEKECAFSPHLQ